MSRQVVTFAFHPGVPRERQDEILSEVEAWNEIDHAGRVNPDSPIESFARICYAYLNDGAGEVIERLAAIPEIETASSPAPRHLI